jgi:hypothetical protein
VTAPCPSMTPHGAWSGVYEQGDGGRGGGLQGGEGVADGGQQLQPSWHQLRKVKGNRGTMKMAAVLMARAE